MNATGLGSIQTVYVHTLGLLVNKRECCISTNYSRCKKRASMIVCYIIDGMCKLILILIFAMEPP